MSSKLDITVLSGVSAGDVFHFTVSSEKPLMVGRATECDLVLQDPMVSRKHLQVERREKGFFLVDLGSTHGTVHMGFQLQPGPENARQLHAGDEFKIGELLFKVDFDEAEFAPKPVVEKSAAKPVQPSGKSITLPPILRGRKGGAIAAIVVGLLVLLFLSPEKGGLPPQKSNEVIKLPSYGVIGYWPNGSDKKGEKDTAHLDKGQFDIPASDVLIEFDYVSDSKLSVMLDGIKVEELDPSPGSWQIRQIIVRGLATGQQRRLVIDNLDYPRAEGARGGPLKRWAVRDMRAAPLSSKFGIEPGFDSHLAAAAALIEGIDKGPNGLFLLVRALQTAAVELMKELKVDAVGYRVDPGAEDVSKIANISELRQRIDVIKRSREQAPSMEVGQSSLSEINRVTAQLDAEIWRRVNNRLTQAKLSARVKNYIEAHDQLVSAQGMFPAEADFRWTLADRMLMDKKIVPKRIRENPENFRK